MTKDSTSIPELGDRGHTGRFQSWWSHDIETLPELLNLCEGNISATSGSHSRWPSKPELWWPLSCRSEQPPQWTVDLPPCSYDLIVMLTTALLPKSRVASVDLSKDNPCLCVYQTERKIWLDNFQCGLRNRCQQTAWNNWYSLDGMIHKFDWLMNK